MMNNPFMRRDVLKTAYAGVIGIATFSTSAAGQNSIGGDELWRFEPDEDNFPSIWSSPTVVDHTVYIGYGGYNRLYAIDSETGDKQWEFEAEHNIISSPAVVDNTVYAGSMDGKVYALDSEDGIEQWTYETDDGVQSSPTVVNGIVYVGSNDNTVYALDAEDGTEQWAYETGGDIESSPTVVDGTVYVGSHDGKVYALNAADGSKEWDYETLPVEDDDENLQNEVRSSPTVADGVVYVGSDDNRLYALDADTGSVEWSEDLEQNVSSSPTVANETVYVGTLVSSEEDDPYNVYALDANSGDRHWRVKVGVTNSVVPSVRSAPTVVNNTVFVGTYGNDLHAIDANDGSNIWNFETEQYVFSSPTVVDGTVYVGDNAGILYAIDAGVNDSSEGSRVNLGTLGHHHEWAEEQGETIETPETELDLGILTADSGPLGPIGSPIGDAAELPAQQLSETDNLDLNVDIVRRDTETDPSVGVDVAEQLADNDIPVTVGPASSSVTAEVNEEVLIPNGIVGISPSATDPALTDLVDDGFFFRTVPSDIWQSQAGAKYAVEELGAETVGTLWLAELSDGFSAVPELEAAFVEEVELRDGTTAERVELEQNAESYVDDLETVLEPDPDVLYILVGPDTGIQLLEEFYEEFADDHTVDILVSDLLATDDVPESIDAPLDEVTGTVQAGAGPGYDEFFTLYQNEFDRQPETFTSNAYDAAAVALLASIAADTSEGSEIRDEIRSITQSGGTEIGPETLVDGVEQLADGNTIEYHGAATELTFDEKGDVEPPVTYDIFAYENEETTIVDTVKIGETTDGAVFGIEIVSPDDGEEVTEDEALDVSVEVTNTGGEKAEKTVKLTSPIEDNIDIEVAAGTTETVSFGISGDEIYGDVEITAESPDDTDQVVVTAVDPCFIATAAYDTPTAEEIDILRDFRDDVLRRNVLGRLFIKSYYWGSPPIARWIRQNSTRRELVKQYFVEPLVNIVQTRSNMWEYEREQ